MTDKNKPEGIILGSWAAKLGGFLPEWREGRVNDLDLCSSAAWGEEFLQRMKWSLSPAYRAARPGKALIVRNELPIIDLDFSENEIYRRVRSLCTDTTELELGDVTVQALVAPLEVVWIMRTTTIGLSPARLVKSVKDSVWYEGLEKNLTPEVLELSEMYRLDSLHRMNAQIELREQFIPTPPA